MLIRFKSLTTHTTAAVTDLAELYFISNAASRLENTALAGFFSGKQNIQMTLNTKDHTGQKPGQAST